MIPVCGDSPMAFLDRRFAKIPRPKRPEESRAISGGREDSRFDDSLRSSRQAHADNRQARSKSVAIRRVELASRRRVPQDPARMRMLMSGNTVQSPFHFVHGSLNLSQLLSGGFQICVARLVSGRVRGRTDFLGFAGRDFSYQIFRNHHINYSGKKWHRPLVCALLKAYPVQIKLVS